MTGRFLQIAFGLVLAVPSWPADAFDIYRSRNVSLSLKGYYKNLYFNSKRQVTGGRLHADLNRLRTEWDAKFGKVLTAKVVWDNELIGGDYVASEEFDRRQAQRADPYLDLDYELAREGDFFYGQQLYRAYARLDLHPVVLTVGRQKIDWGVMRLFSPVDLFTFLPLFDIEKDERVGVTAGDLTISPVPGIKLDAAYAVHPDFDRARAGARLTKTLGRFDVSVLGGKFLEDEVFGFDFAGDVKKAGVRGEFLYDRAEFGEDFVQFAAGVDYGWENSLYVALEYFFNGQGTNDGSQAASRGTALAWARSGSQIRSVHKNFLSLQVKYDITPLWKVMLMDVVDLNGGSTFLNPETKYSPLSWLEITGGAHLPFGKTDGEFTRIPNVYYFQTQAFF